MIDSSPFLVVTCRLPIILVMILSLLNLANYTAFSVIVSLSTFGLFQSYLIAIVCGLTARLSGRFKEVSSEFLHVLHVRGGEEEEEANIKTSLGALVPRKIWHPDQSLRYPLHRVVRHVYDFSLLSPRYG